MSNAPAALRHHRRQKPLKAAQPANDWRGEAMALLNRGDLDTADRALVLKLRGWRAPGADGLRRLRAIAEQLGTANGQ